MPPTRVRWKVSTDALIAALLHPRLYLMGNEDGGVELHCRDHFDGGRPLACYDRSGSGHPDPAVAWVATVPSLWAEAVKHLAGHHSAIPIVDGAEIGRSVVEAIKRYENRGKDDPGPEPQPA